VVIISEEENEIEEDQEDDIDKQKQRDELNNLGVENTWKLLSDSKDKKKPPEEKRIFRGFK